MSMITTKNGDFSPLHFIFKDNMILLTLSDSITLPDDDIVQKCIDMQIVKDWFSEPSHEYTALMLEDSPAPHGCRWVPLRGVFAEEPTFVRQAARAHALLEWRASFRFCPRCGGPLIDDKYETARTCMLCRNSVFPHISPAVIVLVEKGDTILLARHAQRNTDMFTCLAGYLEHGESAEECVEREVYEETGISVKNIRYISSQSWPFPDQFMMAFKAEWEKGDFFLQRDEIDEAKWFTRDNLPNIPRPGSVAYKLIMGL